MPDLLHPDPPIDGACHCGAITFRITRCEPETTVCNCTICRRYGALWAYDHDGEGIRVSGPTTAYTRADGGAIAFHFCQTCGCVSHWRGLRPDRDGRIRLAVNLRLSDPVAVAAFPILHFDGLDSFEDTPSRGRHARDYLD